MGQLRKTPRASTLRFPDRLRWVLHHEGNAGSDSGIQQVDGGSEQCRGKLQVSPFPGAEAIDAPWGLWRPQRPWPRPIRKRHVPRDGPCATGWPCNNSDNPTCQNGFNPEINNTSNGEVAAVTVQSNINGQADQGQLGHGSKRFQAVLQIKGAALARKQV